MRIVDEMFYDDVTLCQVMLTIRPKEKISKSAGGKGNKYYIAEFEYESLTTEEGLLLETITESLELWREETLTGDAETLSCANYSPPTAIVQIPVTAEEATDTNTAEA